MDYLKPHSKADTTYARKIGVDPRYVKIRGGAPKLHTLAPHVAKVLMAEHDYGNSQTVHEGGLRKRGFRYAPRNPGPAHNSAYERLVQEMLRERGLIKE